MHKDEIIAEVWRNRDAYARKHHNNLREAIRARRKQEGLSQEELAELADVHRNYIGLIERAEQNLTVDSLVKVSKALKCKVADLIVQAQI